MTLLAVVNVSMNRPCTHDSNNQVYLTAAAKELLRKIHTHLLWTAMF
jgi:hypothetical protein